MPVPTPSNVIRIRLLHGLGFDTAIGSRIFYSYTDASAPSTADLNTLCTNVRTAWSTNLAGQLSSDGVLEKVICDDLASASGNQGTNTTTAAGTRAGHYFDQMQAVVINFRIATRYRGGKPKVFLPFGIVTDAETGNLWANAFVTGLTTAWGNFTTALNGLVAGGITLGTQQNVSYYKGAGSRPLRRTHCFRPVSTCCGALYHPRSGRACLTGADPD